MVRRRGPAQLGLISVPVATLLMGCVPDPVHVSLWETAAEPGERTLHSVSWDTLWSFGSAADTTLLLPLRIRPHSDGALVLDGLGQRIISLGPGGEVRWGFGSPGQGPGEFTALRDIRISADERRVFAYDPGNGRVTILGMDGRPEAFVPLHETASSEVMAVVGDSLLVLIGAGDEAPVVYVSAASGEVVSRTSLPWNEFNQLPNLVRQGTMASSGDRWAFLFHWGNGFFAYRGADVLPWFGQFIEHTPFPGVVIRSSGGPASSVTTTSFAERPLCSACSAAIDGDHIYVLFGGATEYHRQVIDRYEWMSGRYVDSLLLPSPASEIAVREGRVYTLARAPYPRIDVLRATFPEGEPIRAADPESSPRER